MVKIMFDSLPMVGLLDRYFLVVSERVAGVVCDVVASPFTPTGSFSLGWPLDLPEEPEAASDAPDAVL